MNVQIFSDLKCDKKLFCRISRLLNDYLKINGEQKCSSNKLFYLYVFRGPFIVCGQYLMLIASSKELAARTANSGQLASLRGCDRVIKAASTTLCG